MEEIIQLDKALFLYLNTQGTPTWDGFWIFLSERSVWIPLYLLLLYLLFKHFGFKQTVLVLGLTLLMILFTDQITNVFKNSFQRLRPCFTAEFDGIMRKVGCERRGQFGFTSAHASNHFGIALFLGLVFRKKYKWMLSALLIWAAFISYSRVYLGVHFPLDILCGSALGLILAGLNFRLYSWILKKYPKTFKEN